jgi:outer membrane protein
LQVDNVKSFSQQFRNNGGEYIGATLSIPIFNRLSTLSSIRRARNNYHLACENYNQKRLELQKLYIEAVLDCNGYMKESEQMEKKVVSDSLAYALVRGQYEEGLVTAIDLQTSAASLLNSRALLSQSSLMAVLKERMARYYKGEMRMRHR